MSIASGLNPLKGCDEASRIMASIKVVGWRWSGSPGLAALVAAGAALAACADAPGPAGSGLLSGQVVVSGPLRNARVSIDQILLQAQDEITIRAHVADATTDDDGWFGRARGVEVGELNGLFLLTASGGSYTDLATGATIQLDPTTTLETITPFALFEVRDDVLVSPVGHLIAARTRWKVSRLGDVLLAQHEAAEHMNRHFGSVVDWTHLRLGALDAAATSPTEAVRASLVHAGLSFLAQDIATMAGASPQEVNVLALTKQLAADIGQDAFDGNDGNAPTSGEGLQVGVCAPITGCSPPPTGGCGLGACRPLCDLYAGTPRTLLAGEVTKVIGSPAINHTGLVTGDILAVARAMADNLDEDLFGSACIETLDRLPPTLGFRSPTPAEGSFVRGTAMLKVAAIDDLDPAPTVRFLGHVDADGDPKNSIAIAAIDTLTEADGPLAVTAQGMDMAGNTATITRVLQVDNTAPVVTLDATGCFVDGATWWTTAAAPTLHGTVTEANPAGVEAVIGATHLTGTISGATWSVPLPAGMLDLTGADVHVVVTDAAGNQGTVVQRLRYDATPPTVSLEASPMHDEASEAPAFSATPSIPATDEVPSHIHGGAVVDLAIPGACPSLTKYSYLLGATPPPYGAEPNGRNPLFYQLLVADDGVGIDPAATRYRVGRDAADGSVQWVTAWTSVGAGVPVAPGVTRYTVPIYADTVPGLDALEGVYRVQLQSTDRLGRTTTEARCFDLHLRAPPLHLGAMTVGSVTYLPGDAQGHQLALKSLNLAPGATFDQIASRVLNASAASSLLDMPVINGTASTVYLTVTVTRPVGVSATQRFALRYVKTISAVNLDCDAHPDDPDCEPVPLAPPIYDGTDSPAVSGLVYPVRVYLLDAAGVPATQIPCLGGCRDTDSVFRFALPPRGPSAAPLRFLVMSMVGQITALWPQDGSHPAAAPFSDLVVSGTHLTGDFEGFPEGCSKLSILLGVLRCREVTSYVAYRALTSVSFMMAEPLRNTYATSAGMTTSAIDPWGGPVATSSPFTWSTAEGTLP
jgi:hypothetical protein